MLTKVNKLVRGLSVDYMTARKNEIELQTTKFYNLHIINVEKFHKKSVCHKIEGVHMQNETFWIHRSFFAYSFIWERRNRSVIDSAIRQRHCRLIHA